MKDVLKYVKPLLKEGHDFVVATIVKQEGSAPRKLGTRMLILDNFQGKGTIGGGLLEAQVIAEAQDVLSKGESKIIQFRLTGRDASEADMLCGGNVEVFLNPISAKDKNFAEVFDAVEEVLQRGGRGILVEEVTPGIPGNYDPKEANLRWLFIVEGGGKR